MRGFNSGFIFVVTIMTNRGPISVDMEFTGTIGDDAGTIVARSHVSPPISDFPRNPFVTRF